MMTRKDYKAIAAIIQQQTIVDYRLIPRDGLVNTLANYMAADNPQFDRERFIKACSCH